MKKCALFIDRDGTIIVEPQDEQIDSLEKLFFLPGAITALAKIAQQTDFELVMVSNQDGLGSASFPEDTFWPAHSKMLAILEAEGVTFSAIHIDPTLPEDNAPTRKPRTGMLTEYISADYDLENSIVIGDRESDIELAKNLGAKSIYLSDTPHPDASFTTTNWQDIYKHLACAKRTTQVTRKTKETDISIRLNLDGSGQAKIESGLGFFDHMLEQLARHALCDLEINVKGDLAIDEHHTIEDTALALGAAFKQALGDKRGIERYGFLLPMDDALTQVAIDFSGRDYLVWEAEFRREKIGEMPTEMFEHFFRSFCDAAECNLNIKAEGQNEHHKIEAIFKAWAKAIKAAVARDPEKMILPSTKGML